MTYGTHFQDGYGSWFHSLLRRRENTHADIDYEAIIRKKGCEREGWEYEQRGNVSKGHEFETKMDVSHPISLETVSLQVPYRWVSSVPQSVSQHTVYEPDLTLIVRANGDRKIKQKYAQSIDRVSTGGMMVPIIYGRDAFFRKVKDAVRRSNHSIVAIVKHWRIDYELKELMRDFNARGGKSMFLGPKADKVDIWRSIGAKIRFCDPAATRFTVWDKRIITIGFKQDKEYFSLWIENEYLGEMFYDFFIKEWKRAKL